MKVIKFAPGLIPVLKHQEHDQSTHGSWSDGQEDYKMGHRPGDIESGASLDNVSGNDIYPDDVYTPNGLRNYSTGYPELDKEAHALIMRAKGNPEMTVTIYRAVPNDAKITEIKDGDWVTPTKGYAKIHGESNLNDDYKIISAEVKAKDIYTSGDSWHEWGYSKSPSVEKHQEHDQSSHGNWAEGSESSSSELSNDSIRDIISGSDTVNEMYQKVAERLGKSMKPKLENLSEEEINFFRGVTDVNIQAQSLLDGEIRFTPFQTWGQGIYISSEPEYAQTYGELIGLKLDKSAKLVEGEIAWAKAYSLFDKETSLDMPKILDRITSGKMDNFSDSDIANIYWAAKGYDGYSVYKYGRAEVVLFNADKLTVNKTDIGEAVRKHLQNQHDQRTHGSWAGGGGAGVDITEALDEVFFKEKLNIINSSLTQNTPGIAIEAAVRAAGNNVETLDLIEDMDFAETTAGRAYGDNALKIIAERQGFTEKPKTVETLEDLENLAKLPAEQGGGFIVFRGIADYSSTGDSEVTYTAEQALTDFREGEYFGGWGAFGNGTYTTSFVDSAQGYADDVDPDNNKLGNGKVMAMMIPDTAKAPTAEVVKTVMKEMVWGGEKSHRNNVGRRLAAMGYQYYDAGHVQDDKRGIYVVLDRSMLTVAEKAVSE